jgi:hypothetical protein
MAPPPVLQLGLRQPLGVVIDTADLDRERAAIGRSCVPGPPSVCKLERTTTRSM